MQTNHSDGSNAMNERFILEQNNDTFWKLEGIKNDEFWNVSRMIHFANWNETRMMLFGTKQAVKNDHFWKLEQNKNKFLFGNGESNSKFPNVFN